MQILFFFLLAWAKVQDPCFLMATTEVVRYWEAMACYTQFQLSKAVQRSTINALHKAVSLVINDELDSQALHKKLDIFSQLSFSSEFQFQMGLVDIFNVQGMQYDAGCFSSFRFHSPLEVVVVEEQTPTVKVPKFLNHNPKLLEYWRILGIHPSNYIGKTIVFINSMPALQYLIEFSNARGLSHFNQALARAAFRDGKWKHISGEFANTSYYPSTETLEFEFSDGTTLVAPILVTAPSNFNDSAYFYATCLTQQRSHTEIEPSFVILFNQTKAALSISSFTGSFYWEKNMTSALLALSPAKELLLDLRDSSGDNVCGSYHLLNYLIPNTNQTHYKPTLKTNQNLERMMHPCRHSFISCKVAPFITKIFNCQKTFLPTNKNPFNPSDIVIVTNGLCSGACAILFHGLVDSNVSKIYFVGPSNMNPPISTSTISYPLHQLHADLKAPPIKANLFFPLAQFTTSRGNRSMSLDKFIPITPNYTLSNQESLLFNAIPLYTTILNTNTDPTITFPKL
ncbi:hypothetical protein DSO57_1009300 [Entomophthora muscae]|uniref:Uncharacterized protein n=1 Tax=Entomophthora muscae TaxID=34485 RepID=A0ACC2RLL8_9FUNG|nr:hypothetical protein DSO57_1009300 [Entomophthora muscae]